MVANIYKSYSKMSKENSHFLKLLLFNNGNNNNNSANNDKKLSLLLNK